MLNPIHLRTLAAVLEHGTFSAAAQSLGYTTQAVSQHVAALEKSTGLTLFERLPRGIQPTWSAHYLHDSSANALATLMAVERDAISIAAGDRGEIRLGGFPTASRQLIPVALARFTADHPKAIVSFDQGSLEEILTMVTEGVLDLGVVFENDLGTPEVPESLDRLKLMTETRSLLVPAGHRLAGRDEVGIEELAEETWVASQQSPVLQRLCSAHGFEPRIAHRTDDFDVMRALVGAGLGVAIVPALGLLPERDVVILPTRTPLPSRRVGVIWRRSNTNPLLPKLVEALRTGVEHYFQTAHTDPT